MNPYYQDESVTIYHGDCREIIPTLGVFDLVLTDPPYGIGRDKGMGGQGWDSTGKYKRNPRQYSSRWDDNAPDKELLEIVLETAPISIVWGGNYLNLPRGGKWLVWNKEQVMPSYSDAELAWTNLHGVKVHLFTLNCNKARVEMGLHPTQKPLALMAWCLRISEVPVGACVFDPFAGSGTVGRVAKDSGRRAVLVEREERYCEIAAKRMAQQVLW